MAAPHDRLQHYLQWRTVLDDPFVELDLSYSGLTDADLGAREPALRAALVAMSALEGGAIANPDEDRMVGHYWLRAPGLAPEPALQEAIAGTVAEVERFAHDVHDRKLSPPEGGCFDKVVLCGIGGSALGPMLLNDAFGGGASPMALTVLDNTDPRGIDRELERLGSLQDALVLVVSKSGTTPETRNVMLEIERACRDQKISFAARAVAVTGEGSALHKQATGEGWLRTFPMWDWVGGRTSIASAVGLLPLALIGADVRGFLAGAAAMDQLTRGREVRHNPAALLAAFWHAQGKGLGERAMVVLPYCDQLLLLSRYLQQLVMESLGKANDRKGRTVRQGIAVYGNKGSTDQHAFVQQLRDGRHDFFVQFVRVLDERRKATIEVEPGITSGDYLDGLWQGTRSALWENGRASATVCLQALNERSLGALIALFERTVGLYAEMIDVNAYHQPGVEAGKKAAAAVLALQRRLHAAVGVEPKTVGELGVAVGADPADCWPILCHLAANRPGLLRIGPPDPEQARFSLRAGQR